MSVPSKGEADIGRKWGLVCSSPAYLGHGLYSPPLHMKMPSWRCIYRVKEAYIVKPIGYDRIACFLFGRDYEFPPPPPTPPLLSALIRKYFSTCIWGLGRRLNAAKDHERCVFRMHMTLMGDIRTPRRRDNSLFRCVAIGCMPLRDMHVNVFAVLYGEFCVGTPSADDTNVCSMWCSMWLTSPHFPFFFSGRASCQSQPKSRAWPSHCSVLQCRGGVSTGVLWKLPRDYPCRYPAGTMGRVEFHQ